MPAGHRDAHALETAHTLTETAARIRAARDKVMHETTTRVELDGDAVASIRRDLSDSLGIIAEEIAVLKRTLMALRDAAEDELGKRR